MTKIIFTCLFFLATFVFHTKQEMMLFDFNSKPDVTDWSEESDTVRSAGLSKAALISYKNNKTERAIFFSLINPQPNGAGFAGVRTKVDWDLGNYNMIGLNIRGQGENFQYKLVLRNPNLTYTFEQFFQAPIKEFDTIFLPLNQFKPYFRGKHVNTNNTLDETSIEGFGLQMFGGVYKTYKQKGASSLEINWIKAYP